MWDNITVGKFQQIHDIIAGQRFETELEQRMHVLACLEEKEVSHYEALLIGDLLDAVKKTRFLNIEDIPQVEVPRKLNIGKREYKMVYDFRVLSAGQFIDALQASKEKDEYIMNLNRLMAAFSVPMDGKYGDVPYDEVADDMLQVGIKEAQAVAVFFWNVWETFLKSLPDFLQSQRRKLKRMTKAERTKWEKIITALEAAGVGS